MSGARTAPSGGGLAPRSSRPAWGSAFCGASRLLPRRELKPLPARNASSTTRAIAATIQGREADADRGAADTVSDTGEETDPVGRPQFWQKRAPGVTLFLHPAHIAGSSEAPQFEQNLPVPGVEHVAQMTSEAEGWVMRYKLVRETNV